MEERHYIYKKEVLWKTGITQNKNEYRDREDERIWKDDETQPKPCHKPNTL